MLRELRTGRRVATTLCLASMILLGVLLLLRGGHLAEAAPAASIAASLGANGLPKPPEPDPTWRSELRWSKVRRDGDGYIQMLKNGGRVELTLDPAMQAETERALAESSASYAAAVMISVDDGRLLALAGRSQIEPELDAADLALTPWAPAASIFKLVTAAALVENGIGADARVCYHDGVHSVEASNLIAHPRWDRSCRTLAFGVAKSQNAIIARLAHQHLDADDLDRTARALGFGETLPFALPVQVSDAQVPRDDDLAFARVAAGFWRTTLSPLHGAYLAATLARGGTTPPMRLVDRVVDRQGEGYRPEGPASRRVLSETAARAVSQMMVGTTQYGTARLGFHDRKSGRPVLPGIAVAGKTGTLNRPAIEGEPFLSYSWFVGFAPAERPEVAFAVLLGNGPDWHKKAHNVAAELLGSYFNGPAPRDSKAVRYATR
jgi:penicillin-binding protein A